MAVREHVEPARRTRRRRIELRPKELRRRLDPARLRFESTAEVEPLVGTIGQPRALEALDYGLDVTTYGFNLFVAGAAGSGRLTTVLDYLQARAPARPTPDDWVYVHNFANPDHPRAIALPAGRGTAFARDMDALLEVLKREIPRAFESEEYEQRRREILGEIAAQRTRLEEELKAYAAERSVAIETTVTGVVSIPLLKGKPISREQFERLPESTRDQVTRASTEVEQQTGRYIHRLHQLEKEAARRVRELEQEVALFASERLFGELEETYREQPGVLAYLAEAKEDLLAHLADFREGEPSELPFALAMRARDHGRFRVNVFVDHANVEGAPVVVERNPTYYNLLGRIEYRATFGAMVTDFREIKPGALHRANGGFLVVEALDVLRHPFAWEALKRALRARATRIENLGEEFSALPSASLRPEPIPLEVKVILLGSPALYHLLYQFDEDFRELFKVKVDFAPELDWTAEHERHYAAFVSRLVRENGLRHFDRAAVARIVEYGARLRESQNKLSARLLDVSDVASEAAFWAERRGHALVQADDVELAVRKKEYRSSLLEEHVQELIGQGTLVIETDGASVGQLNGISILDLGDYTFGRPCRVSARVSLGRGRVESIEREIELSGPIHSKGFMILSGYLASTYAQEWPLALSASLTFEQSYDEIEGDSASSTELYALLSALSGLPLDQGIAVTGSVDQNGSVQAVGGVNRKVEGFYATCKAKGLTGRQGVVIPAANVHNLMLDEEVVDAVRDGRFHVWAIRTVDEGIELLTGTPAGRRRADGSYPERSVHALVASRLAGYAQQLRAFAEPEPTVGERDGRSPR
ncbi:MAG TPA: ATP-binding protein [Gaiellaceae bacterium]|jgi:lon-related putative ATP-dependent protease